MQKINNTEMRSVNGGWYFGNVYCPSCGKKVNPTWPARVMYSKRQLELMAYACHYGNATNGGRILH